MGAQNIPLLTELRGWFDRLFLQRFRPYGAVETRGITRF